MFARRARNENPLCSALVLKFSAINTQRFVCIYFNRFFHYDRPDRSDVCELSQILGIVPKEPGTKKILNLWILIAFSIANFVKF